MSSSECEHGTCDVCGQEAVLSRHYYHYSIKCKCCLSSGKPIHFHMVRHCSNCTPKPPKSIRPILQASDYLIEEGETK